MSQNPYQQPNQPQPQWQPPQKRRRSGKKTALIVVGSIVGAFIVLGIAGAIIGPAKTSKTADATTPATSPAAVPSPAHTVEAASAKLPANGGSYANGSVILTKLAAADLPCTAPSQMAESAAVLFEPGATSLVMCTSPDGKSDDTGVSTFDTAANLHAYEKQIEGTDSSIAGGQLAGVNWVLESTPAYAKNAETKLGGTLTIIPAGPPPTGAAGAPSTPADTLTGYGATVTTWDANHTADTTFTAGSVFDPNPSLPQINGNEGARYSAVTPLGGLVEDYTVNEMNGTSVTAAFTDVVSRELPSDTLVVWKRDQSANGCYQEEVQSKTLAKVLGGQGAVLLEAQSANPAVLDSSNVATVMVAPGDSSVSESDAPGC